PIFKRSEPPGFEDSESISLIIVTMIFKGILCSGNLSLAKTYKEKVALDFNALNFSRDLDCQRCFDAAAKSNNLEMLLWLLSEMPFDWIATITLKKIQE